MSNASLLQAMSGQIFNEKIIFLSLSILGTYNWQSLQKDWESKPKAFLNSYFTFSTEPKRVLFFAATVKTKSKFCQLFPEGSSY